jgi:PAS domain S-box-containing protein
LHRAECEIQTGDLAAAEQRLSMLAARAEARVDQAAVACLRALLYMTLARPDQAVETCLDYLRRTGIDWTAHPTEADVRVECDRLWRQLDGRPIGSLIQLPLMVDPDERATMDVLCAMAPAATLTDENLPDLVCVRMANLSIEHGNSDASCYAYTLLNSILGLRFGDYASGYQFGQLSVDLVEHVGLDRFKARVYSTFGHMIIPWTREVRASRPWSRRAFDAALESGDFVFWVYCCGNQINERLVSGDPLEDVQREAENGLAFARKVRFGIGVAIITGQLLLIRALRGVPTDVLLSDAERFDEERFEQQLESDPLLVLPAGKYWIRKLQARFYAGDYGIALEAAVKAQRFAGIAPGEIAMADYQFYSALTLAASCPTTPSSERRRHLDAVAAHRAKLAAWAVTCPENFADRAVLVEAEMACLEGRELDAERLYEQAIRLAAKQGFVQNEGLANELAARFYGTRGLETIARAYLRNARYCYERWGAHGKLRQLDQLYPDLRKDAALPQPAHTIGAAVEQLDLATVVKVSQAVSGEMVLTTLIEKLMTIALEHAGAERGLLLLPLGADLRVEAEAASTRGGISVRLAARVATAADLPDSVLKYVSRTKGAVIIDDASAKGPFSGDEYFVRVGVRSALCLPLVKQGTLTGVLYLENTVAAHVFTPDRVTVLELLAAQAAISLENTRLYSELQEREAKIRRLVDANIIGIIIWDVDGRIIEANDAFLAMLGYSRDDLVARRIQWTDITPPEWRASDRRRLARTRAVGSSGPVEKEYFRRDGSRVPVLIGAATFEGTRDEGVAFVLDLTERKRAEEALRRAQAELAHVTRVATLGELTGSIAHEINQPLGAVVNNASACLRWLAAQNLEEARQSAARVIADGHRASEIIGRIRALARKAPARKDWLDINETVREVLGLAKSEVQGKRVVLRTGFAEALPPVWGDRIQVQQVLLNLVVNAIEAMSAMEEGPRELGVSTDKGDGAEAVIAVRDTGPGLDPQGLDRLFDAFYTTKPGGLGMGLAISRSIVESHGGRLWATANAPRGAVFQFTLPIGSDGRST